MNIKVSVHLLTAIAICLAVFFLTSPIGGRIFWEDSVRDREEQFEQTQRQEQLQEDYEKAFPNN